MQASFEIVRKEDLNSDDYLVEVRAPLVAKKWKAGQFVVFRLHENGERIPMSIYDADAEKGTIVMFIKKLGKTSRELYEGFEVGTAIKDVMGPSGNSVEFKKYGNVVVASDLVCGHAENYAISKTLKELGNYVISIQGFATKDMRYVTEEEELRGIADEYYISTEDGSYGMQGAYTDLLEKVLKEHNVDMVFAGGTFLGLKKVAEITKSYNVPAMVTLRTIMVDGTGLCGSCRVEVDGETKFACVDGPIFDAHKVNFDLVIKRNERFLEEEKQSFEKWSSKR
ncbi:MAG: sulfide/dihydroorotate dehydrogenase-like FAD/NAD-binding protein [Dehalococcoidia bacterium]